MTRLNVVKKLIDDKFDGNQADFARAIKKAPAQVNQWLNGYRNIGDAVALHIEKSLDLPIGFLDGEQMNYIPPTGNKAASRRIESNVSSVGQIIGWSDSEPLDSEEFAMVPFYKDVSLAAGTGAMAEDDYNGFKLAFAKSTLRKCGVQDGKAVCVSVSGDSMEPVLPDGATVGIDTGSRHIKDGQMYAIRHGDLLRVKVLRKNANGTVRIISFNADAYPEEIGALGEEVDIIGRVFASMVLYP